MQVLHQLPKFASPELLVGTETADDAGVYQLRPDLAIVNTVDFFTPIVDDPYMFGQIAATNSLSDVYAMGGVPVTALNIVCFPKGKMDIQVLGEVLRGGADKVIESGCVIVGGHSIIDEEIKYGLSVTGTVHPDRILRNIGGREGDVLILTKPLGTGIATTALKRGNASEASIEQAVASMATLNKYAADVMKDYDVHACSDITGFGLLGHGLEMTSDGTVSIVFEAARLPVFQDVARLAEGRRQPHRRLQTEPRIPRRQDRHRRHRLRRTGRGRPRPPDLRRPAHRRSRKGRRGAGEGAGGPGRPCSGHRGARHRAGGVWGAVGVTPYC